MNDELRQQLSDELPPDVPFTLNVEETIEAGRRSKRRKSLLITGGATTSVAAVAAIALAVGVIIPGNGAGMPTAGDGATTPSPTPNSTSPKPSQEPPEDPPADDIPEFVLPEIDPDGVYQWDTGLPPLEVNEHTAHYQAALADAMEAVYPDYQLVNGDPELQMVRGSNELRRIHEDGKEKVVSLPVYITNGDGSNDAEDDLAEMSEIRFAGTGHDELFSVTVWPAAEYEDKLEKTSADPFPCEPQKPLSPIMCSDQTVEGQPILYQESEQLEDGEPTMIKHRTALFRDNGTVVEVTNIVAAKQLGQDRLNGQEPTTRLPDQQELALSLPDTVVVE